MTTGQQATLVFVTGTDTDAGKTVATAALTLAARRRGMRVQALKPVQTGCPAVSVDGHSGTDADVYLAACPDARALALETFILAASPHLAASREGRALTAHQLAEAILARRGDADITFVEGAGGLLAPLNNRETFADLIALLPGARVVLVTANRLGTINHTLLAVEALRARGIEPLALVATQPDRQRGDDDGIIARDNMQTIARFAAIERLVEIPYDERLGRRELSDADQRRDAWSAAATCVAPILDALAGEDARPPRRVADVPEFDRRHLWHPYAKTHPPTQVWEVTGTRGTRLRLADGRELVDGMSSWWAAIHGYNHPALTAAIREQAAAMPHVMFGGLTHRPAAELARRLLAMAPEGVDRVFFCDSGSVAMEVALKMALQYQQAHGAPRRRRIVSPRGGYHGDTLGAMSVCDPETGMHRLFAGVVPEQVFFERPGCAFGAEFREESLASMEAAFGQYGDDIAAAVIEPIVQGAGGMWFYHPDYLKRLRELCDRHGALLVCDEIATGFGRTGRMFACEWADTRPDILAVGKALTGGTMTLAAVLARDDIAEVISRDGVFMHGPTFMANPLACRVAMASLDKLERTGWRERVSALEASLRAGLEPARGMAGVADVRVLGGIGVIELEGPVAMDPLMRFFVDECGVWLRPFGTLVYAMPPYIATTDDVAAITTAMVRAVREEIWR